MSAVLTYGIEAAVGVACLVAAHGVRRRPGLRLMAVLLAVAGVAAIAHAAVSLT
ncbi:MAG: hypothetical protein ACXWYT_12160 [Actinomycetota bacterium]